MDTQKVIEQVLKRQGTVDGWQIEGFVKSQADYYCYVTPHYMYVASVRRHKELFAKINTPENLIAVLYTSNSGTSWGYGIDPTDLGCKKLPLSQDQQARHRAALYEGDYKRGNEAEAIAQEILLSIGIETTKNPLQPAVNYDLMTRDGRKLEIKYDGLRNPQKNLYVEVLTRKKTQAERDRLFAGCK